MCMYISVFTFNTGGGVVRRKRDFLEALARPQSCLCCLTKFPELPLAWTTWDNTGSQRRPLALRLSIYRIISVSLLFPQLSLMQPACLLSLFSLLSLDLISRLAWPALSQDTSCPVLKDFGRSVNRRCCMCGFHWKITHFNQMYNSEQQLLAVRKCFAGWGCSSIVTVSAWHVQGLGSIPSPA